MDTSSTEPSAEMNQCEDQPTENRRQDPRPTGEPCGPPTMVAGDIQTIDLVESSDLESETLAQSNVQQVESPVKPRSPPMVDLTDSGDSDNDRFEVRTRTFSKQSEPPKLPVIPKVEGQTCGQAIVKLSKLPAAIEKQKSRRADLLGTVVFSEQLCPRLSGQASNTAVVDPKTNPTMPAQDPHKPVEDVALNPNSSDLIGTSDLPTVDLAGPTDRPTDNPVGSTESTEKGPTDIPVKRSRQIIRQENMLLRTAENRDRLKSGVLGTVVFSEQMCPRLSDQVSNTAVVDPKPNSTMSAQDPHKQPVEDVALNPSSSDLIGTGDLATVDLAGPTDWPTDNPVGSTESTEKGPTDIPVKRSRQENMLLRATENRDRLKSGILGTVVFSEELCPRLSGQVSNTAVVDPKPNPTMPAQDPHKQPIEDVALNPNSSDRIGTSDLPTVDLAGPTDRPTDNPVGSTESTEKGPTDIPVRRKNRSKLRLENLRATENQDRLKSGVLDTDVSSEQVCPRLPEPNSNTAVANPKPNPLMPTQDPHIPSVKIKVEPQFLQDAAPNPQQLTGNPAGPSNSQTVVPAGPSNTPTVVPAGPSNTLTVVHSGSSHTPTAVPTDPSDPPRVASAGPSNPPTDSPVGYTQPMEKGPTEILASTKEQRRKGRRRAARAQSDKEIQMIKYTLTKETNKETIPFGQNAGKPKKAKRGRDTQELPYSDEKLRMWMSKDFPNIFKHLSQPSIPKISVLNLLKSKEAELICLRSKISFLTKRTAQLQTKEARIIFQGRKIDSLNREVVTLKTMNNRMESKLKKGLNQVTDQVGYVDKLKKESQSLRLTNKVTIEQLKCQVENLLKIRDIVNCSIEELDEIETKMTCEYRRVMPDVQNLTLPGEQASSSDTVITEAPATSEIPVMPDTPNSVSSDKQTPDAQSNVIENHDSSPLPEIADAESSATDNHNYLTLAVNGQPPPVVIDFVDRLCTISTDDIPPFSGNPVDQQVERQPMAPGSRAVGPRSQRPFDHGYIRPPRPFFGPPRVGPIGQYQSAVPMWELYRMPPPNNPPKRMRMNYE